MFKGKVSFKQVAVVAGGILGAIGTFVAGRDSGYKAGVRETEAKYRENDEMDVSVDINENDEASE